MKEAAHLLPQEERLVRRIEALELPLVELWGWPGSGTSALLQALLARHDAVGLPLADLAPGEGARAALAAPPTARWVVVAGDPGERLADLASWLRPGQQVVFASRRRHPQGPLAVALLPPQELLLTPDEVARLWHLICGKPARAATVQALWQASDGWFRPLRLALEATGGTGLEDTSAEQLLEIPPVRLFLRHEVLDAVPPPERDLLLAAPCERPIGDGAGGDDGELVASGDALVAAWRVVEDLGLWVEGGDRDRLPALLAACLERERRRRRPLRPEPRPSRAAAANGATLLEAGEDGATVAAGGAVAAQQGEPRQARSAATSKECRDKQGVPRQARSAATGDRRSRGRLATGGAAADRRQAEPRPTGDRRSRGRLVAGGAAAGQQGELSGKGGMAVAAPGDSQRSPAIARDRPEFVGDGARSGLRRPRQAGSAAAADDNRSRGRQAPGGAVDAPVAAGAVAAAGAAAAAGASPAGRAGRHDGMVPPGRGPGSTAEQPAPPDASPAAPAVSALPAQAAATTEAAPATPHPDAARPTYRVRLFGGPMVRQLAAEGEREVGWKLRRSFQVLAFLASSPDLEAGREDLEEAVWPSDGERTIDRNFHPTLSHLRRALEREERGSVPPPLLYRGGIYRLNPEITWDIDLQEFNRRAAEGRELAARGEERAAADTWLRAWKLYRGPFLQGYYQAWVTARREECQQAYVELLRDLGDLSVRLDRAESALDAYRSVLLEDPLQERTHMAVMRLYAGQGRRDLVRRQYERLCTLLLDELGVEPLPETVQEYHRLMS